MRALGRPKDAIRTLIEKKNDDFKRVLKGGFSKKIYNHEY